MWASELYQIVAIAAGVFLVASLPWVQRAPQWLRTTLVVLAVYRLAEIATFALHWLIVDRRPVKDFRRSLIAFCLNLAELAIFATIVVFLLETPSSNSPWLLLYTMASAVFGQSIPKAAEDSTRVTIFKHTVIVEAWLLVLVVLAAVINGVTRDDLSVAGASVRDASAAPGEGGHDEAHTGVKSGRTIPPTEVALPASEKTASVADTPKPNGAG